MRNIEGKSGLSRLSKNKNPYDAINRSRNYRKLFYTSTKPKNTTMSADTKERYEIHSLIKKSLEEGKGKIEILSELLNKYPNSTGRNYFEQYIEHHMTKMKIKDNSKEISKDDEGR